MNSIKWGIIGTGRIAHTFADALRQTENACLKAVASRSLEKAQDFAGKYGFEKAYGSYRELAHDPDVDVVYIATPMASHYDDTILCLNSGKNVLCEKSVSLNSGQLSEMHSLAKSKSLFFMEAMWMKCRPVFLKAKEWTDTGKIGEIRYIKADFSNFVPFDQNDRLFRPDCGGGALLDLAVYPLTLTHAFLGFPDEIISNADVRNGVDLSNSIILRYNSGAFASLDSGFEMQLSNNAVIAGTEGNISFGNWFHCTDQVTLTDIYGNVLENFICENDINGYEYEIREVQRCLTEGLPESPLVPHSGTADVMRIMDECRRQWRLVFPGE